MQFPAPKLTQPLSPWNNANILFLLQQCIINLSPHLQDCCFKGFKNISRALVLCLLWLVTVQYCCDIIRIVVAGNKSSQNKPDILELELSFTSPNREEYWLCTRYWQGNNPRILALVFPCVTVFAMMNNLVFSKVTLYWILKCRKFLIGNILNRL